MSDETPWCCASRSGYVAECPLCPEYGTSLLEPCPGHGGSDENQDRLVAAELHARRSHPGFEYATTTGPRKQWHDIGRPPVSDDGDPEPGWERNVDAGRPGQGWDRFDYTEESYWRRPKKTGQPARAALNNASAGGDATGDVLRTPISVALVGAALDKRRDYQILPGLGSAPGPLIITGNINELTDAVLTAIEDQLDIGDAEAWCKACRRVWDGPRHRCESDAEQRLAAIREVLAGFNDRGVIRVGYSNLDIPTASEVIAAVRAELDRPEEQP